MRQGPRSGPLRDTTTFTGTLAVPVIPATPALKDRGFILQECCSMQNVDLILKFEEAFAREVALGVVVTRPLKSWLYFIPGMFIVDFLRRQQCIRRFSAAYMFPRRQALSGAMALLEGVEPEQVHQQLDAAVKHWLPARAGDPTHLHTYQMRVIQQLSAHYQKLLTAEGGNCIELLRNAYKDRTALEDELMRLNELEEERDRCMPDTAPDDDRQRHYRAIQNQVSMRRTRLIDAVF